MAVVIMPRAIEFQLGGTLRFMMEPEDYAAVYFTITYRDFTITARGKDMAYTLASGTQVHVKVAYVDSAGNPAVVDGPVAWASSDSEVVDVIEESADTALVRAVGPIGQVQITATADADLGEGTRELITPMDITVAAGEAVAGTISPVGPAEPIS
jgi:hypothetical protein